jgi:hypothetical protein
MPKRANDLASVSVVVDDNSTATSVVGFSHALGRQIVERNV